MAKAKTKGKKAEANAKTSKKGGKGKWVVLFILLLAAIGGGAVHYLKLDQPVMAYLETLPISLDFLSGSSSEDEKMQQLSEEQLAQSVIEIEENLMKDQKPVPQAEPEVPKNYYVKVEDCINLTCRQEVIRFLKQEKLPYSQRQFTRKTRYYELISSSVYTRQMAKAKIEEIKRETEIKGEPYLVKQNNRYKISLGQYPQEETGVRVRAELIPHYPTLQIDFEIKPKMTYYKVNSIYAGPFKKSVAKSVLNRLHEHPEYETSEITMR